MLSLCLVGGVEEGGRPEKGGRMDRIKEGLEVTRALVACGDFLRQLCLIREG